jgi:hypothetical protein
MSAECRAARVGVDWYDLNLLVVLQAEWQRDVQRQLPRRIQINHVERDVEHAGSKDETVAGAERASGRFDEWRPHPPCQFARIREHVPDALGRRQDDAGRTDVHNSVSLPFNRILFVLSVIGEG